MNKLTLHRCFHHRELPRNGYSRTWVFALGKGYMETCALSEHWHEEVWHGDHDEVYFSFKNGKRRKRLIVNPLEVYEETYHIDSEYDLEHDE